MSPQQFIEIAPALHVDPDYREDLEALGIRNMDDVFSIEHGHVLDKSNLAAHRRRLHLQLPSRQSGAFLKTYVKTPRLQQIKNWIAHRHKASMADYDRLAAQHLAAQGIGTPKVIAYGSQFCGLWEKRSFILTEQLEGAEALERKLPEAVKTPSSPEKAHHKQEFIRDLARFIRRFHNTGYRHRDLYLAHVFYNTNGEFFLIDLHRAFKPRLLPYRFRVKDIAQLYYSAPGQIFSRSDRLRFYREYTGGRTLSRRDKCFIRQVKAKAWRMADHDIRHGGSVPFAS